MNIQLTYRCKYCEKKFDWLHERDNHQHQHYVYLMKLYPKAFQDFALKIFDEFELAFIRLRGERRKNFTRNDFEKLKKKYHDKLFESKSKKTK